MSTYHFIPYVRDGMAKLLSTPKLGKGTLDPTARNRISLPMTMTLNGTALSLGNENALQLRGPGDLGTVVAEAIIRTGPLHLTPDYAPQKFAFVEFHRPDVPWMFTPGAHNATDESLRPWLVLVVVQQTTATITPPVGDSLPILRCPKSELPSSLDESWTWAHAVYTGEKVEDISTLATNLREKPEQSLSRLLCARKLAPHTAYEACLVPAFEAGRQAGLGQSSDPAEPLRHWTFSTDADVQLPVYYHWSFSTGESDPFIVLAQKIQPWKETDQPQDMDLSHPWEGQPYENATAPILSALRLRGANPAQENIPTRFKDDLTRFLTQPLPPSDPSIPVPPPYYGSWHAQPDKPLDQLNDHWLKTLNLSPSYRVAAALGTKIIQREQEQLVAAAWEQVAELRRVNEFLQRKQFAAAITDSIHKKRLTSLTPPVFSQITEPLVFSESQSVTSRVAGFRSFRATPNEKNVKPREGRGVEQHSGAGGMFSEQVLADRPIAYYRLNEEPGSTRALDSSGNTNDGVQVERGVTFGVPGLGVGDTAAQFDGDMGRIIVRNSDSLNPLQITMEALVKWHGPQSFQPNVFQRILEKSSYAQRGQYSILIDPDGHVGYELRIIDGERDKAEEAYTTVSVTPDTIAHIAVTFDGSTIRIYLDGLLHKETSSPGQLDRKPPDPQNLIINGLGLGNQIERARPFHGIIDEIAIYDKALSPERIRAHALTVFPQTIMEQAAATPQFRRTTRPTGSWSLTGDIRRYNPEHIAPPPGATEGARQVSGYRPSEAASQLANATEPDMGDARKEAWLGATEPRNTFMQEVTHRLNIVPPSKLENTVSEDEPADARFQQPDPLGPYTYAPSFSQPMYEPLRDQFPDMLLPGLNNIPNDRAAELKTNEQFIEAYMVGLNHELSREFLWREFPTLLNTTYFQQFWDASGARNPQTPDLPPTPDLRPISEWATNDLGKNLDPKRGSALTFLLIRGELIVRYPNVMISARLAAPDSNAGTRFPILRFSPIAGALLLGFDITNTTGWKFFAEEHFTEPYLGPKKDDPTEANDYVSFLRMQNGTPMYGGTNSAEVASKILKDRNFEEIKVNRQETEH